MIYYGIPDLTGDETSVYAAWADYLKEHSFPSSVAVFWIVIKIRKEKYSERIERHQDFPLLLPLPKEGNVAGICTSRNEVDALTSSDPEKKQDWRKNYVYLVYKIRLQKEEEWRKLIEFCAAEDLLEKNP